MAKQITIIDNYDSFTFNLVQYFHIAAQKLAREIDVQVMRNDQASVEDLVQKAPLAFVISPGPSTPNEAGVSLALIERLRSKRIPLLGVCLGHQAIGQVFGAKVVRAPEAVHGKTSQIEHDGKGVFRGLPAKINVTRYHSLIVERSSLLASHDITISAHIGDDMIMGLRHESPTSYIEGVQFHPESCLTEHGQDMVTNFVASL